MLNVLHALLCHHRWQDGPHTGHSFCTRCHHYDDHPAVLRAEAIKAAFRKYSPVGVLVHRHDARLRLGHYRYQGMLSLRVHYGWDHEGELPGLHLGLSIWRLELYVGLGSGWQDEDAEQRSLLHVGVSLKTYGLRYIGCWLGHDPQGATLMPGYVYCARCSETLERAPVKAAAA